MHKGNLVLSGSFVYRGSEDEDFTHTLVSGEPVCDKSKKCILKLVLFVGGKELLLRLDEEQLVSGEHFVETGQLLLRISFPFAVEQIHCRIKRLPVDIQIMQTERGDLPLPGHMQQRQDLEFKQVELHGIQPAAVNSQKVWKVQQGIGIVSVRQFTLCGRSGRHKYDGRVTFAKYGPVILHRRFPVADRPEHLASLVAEGLISLDDYFLASLHLQTRDESCGQLILCQQPDRVPFQFVFFQ